jgi:hypothetical protein
MTFLRNIPDGATAILVECRGEDRAAMQVRAPGPAHAATWFGVRRGGDRWDGPGVGCSVGAGGRRGSRCKASTEFEHVEISASRDSVEI